MLPLLGGVASGVMSLIGTQETNEANKENQLQQEAYNTQMSNTAYQRASTDMQAAGLNPAMMFGSGSAASSPTAPSVQYQSPGNAVASGINSAVQLKVADATVDQMAQEVAKSKTDQVLTEAQTATEARKPELIGAETFAKDTEAAKNNSSKVNVDADTDLKKAALPVAQNEALSASNEMHMNSTARNAADVGGFVGGKIKKIMDPAFDLVGSASGLKYLTR